MQSTIIDEYKIFPRIMMLMIKILKYQAVRWYMSLQDNYENITQVARLATGCMGGFHRSLGHLYVGESQDRSGVKVIWNSFLCLWFRLLEKLTKQGNPSNSAPSYLAATTPLTSKEQETSLDRQKLLPKEKDTHRSALSPEVCQPAKSPNL